MLDKEIELIRRLMVKVYEKKTTARKQRSNRNKKKKTVTYYESLARGRMQHKIWKPGEVQKNNIATDGQLQNKVWDPGRQGLKAHDQEIMIIFNLGSLMQGQ